MPAGPIHGGGVGGGAGGAAAQVPFTTRILDSSDVAVAGTELANGRTVYPLKKGGKIRIEGSIPKEGTTFDVWVSYRMSTSSSGNVRLRIDHKETAAGEDPTAALSAGTAFSITPGNDQNQHFVDGDTNAAFSISGVACDAVIVEIVRINDGNDTHGGDMQILDVGVA